MSQTSVVRATEPDARQRILQSAATLFAEAGFDGTSLEAIGRHAKTAKGLACYHFGSKRRLLAAVLEPRLAGIANLAIEAGTIAAPDEALAALIDGFLDAVADDPAGTRLLLSIMVQPSNREIFGQIEAACEPVLRQSEDVVRSIFAERGDDDPAVAEAMLRSQLEGVAFKRVVYGSSFPMEGIRRRLYASYGLAAPAPRFAPAVAPRLRAVD